MSISVLEFESILQLKIQSLVNLLLVQEQMEFEDALEYLYDSKLFALLTDESTKLWHFSAEKLFDMLVHEKKTQELLIPDHL